MIDFGAISAPKSIKNRSKSHSTSILNSILFLIYFLIDFGSILEPKMAPKSIKNRFKNQSNKSLILSSILNRFLNHFQHDPTWPRARFYWENKWFLRFLFFDCCVVALISWLIFDRFWDPVGLQNRSKIDKKSIQKSITKMMQFLIDFGANLTPFWKGFGS